MTISSITTSEYHLILAAVTIQLNVWYQSLITFTWKYFLIILKHCSQVTSLEGYDIIQLKIRFREESFFPIPFSLVIQS